MLRRTGEPRTMQPRVLLVDDEPHVTEALKRVLREEADRKSTRLNSSHSQISYAVFCLKKKKQAHFNRECGLVNLWRTYVRRMNLPLAFKGPHASPLSCHRASLCLSSECGL